MLFVQATPEYKSITEFLVQIAEPKSRPDCIHEVSLSAPCTTHVHQKRSTIT